MNIDTFGISDVGMRREKNEDSFLINNVLDLYIVADGMGGHVGGELASKMAVKTINEIITGAAENKEASILEENGIKSDDYIGQLKYAIQVANNKIFAEAVKDSSLKGMGTTTVVIMVRGGRVYIANVGDSRCYLFRNKEIFQLTQDHSLVGEQLRAGVITANIAKGHKLKNIITRSVGFQEDVEVDIIVKIPREGDRFLLCSDGLTNMLEDAEILEVLQENNLREAGQVLVDMANARGGDDNITAVLSEMKEVSFLSEAEDSEDESTIGI